MRLTGTNLYLLSQRTPRSFGVYLIRLKPVLVREWHGLLGSRHEIGLFLVTNVGSILVTVPFFHVLLCIDWLCRPTAARALFRKLQGNAVDPSEDREKHDLLPSRNSFSVSPKPSRFLMQWQGSK